MSRVTSRVTFIYLSYFRRLPSELHWTIIHFRLLQSKCFVSFTLILVVVICIYVIYWSKSNYDLSSKHLSVQFLSICFFHTLLTHVFPYTATPYSVSLFSGSPTFIATQFLGMPKHDFFPMPYFALSFNPTYFILTIHMPTSYFDVPYMLHLILYFNVFNFNIFTYSFISFANIWFPEFQIQLSVLPIHTTTLCTMMHACDPQGHQRSFCPSSLPGPMVHNVICATIHNAIHTLCGHYDLTLRFTSLHSDWRTLWFYIVLAK